MNDLTMLDEPRLFSALQAATVEAGFSMACEPLTGSLLRTLAATKRGGHLLEIGTGTGIGTSWILDGMDAASTLVSVELDGAVQQVAAKYLGDDPRLTLICDNAETFLKSGQAQTFDFIFADTFPGKFYLLNEALALLKVGGLYIIDDLLPQPNWPENHQQNVDQLIAELEGRSDLVLTKMHWVSGLIVATKVQRS
jgi:predicted O-methyltransferase YrrM